MWRIILHWVIFQSQRFYYKHLRYFLIIINSLCFVYTGGITNHHFWIMFMGIKLNHTIIQAKDAEKSAKFLSEILGLPSPTAFGPFIVVKTDNEVSLDFRTTTSEIKPRHFAFLVSEAEFDEIFNRIIAKKLEYWADPGRTELNKINHNDGGRGCYFLGLDGHFLEIITQPYGNSQS